MNESVLQKYTGRRPEDLAFERQTDDVDGTGAFGWLRGIRDRAVMLELRKKDGSILALSYSWLERAEFDPSKGITLHMAGRAVRIKGRNLNKATAERVGLFEGISRQRIPWVAETGSASGFAKPESDVLVAAIEW